MTHLIDKDIVIAEIERKLKDINLNYVSVGSHPSDSDTNKKLQDGISKTLQSLLSFIDTLEVKEVDLKEEIDKIWKPRFSLGWDDKSLLSVSYKGFEVIAKHFFKLGIKAQKGE